MLFAALNSSLSAAAAERLAGGGASDKPVGCFLKLKQGHDELPVELYRAQYSCEGCLRRKKLLKGGKKPAVSAQWRDVCACTLCIYC